jgi:Ca-activated chloride channel family protein
MKALIPYAILGLIGSVGAVVGTHASSSAPSPSPAPADTPAPAPVVVDKSDNNGAVKVTALLDHTTLPAAGGEVFARVTLEGVEDTSASQQRVPVSLTLVIDRSGSMGSGNKMEDAREAAKQAIASLSPGDRVAVVSFDNGAELHGSTTIRAKGAGDDADVVHLLNAIDALFARGGTDMLSGFDVGEKAALDIADPQRINRLLLLSDGNPDSEANLEDRVRSLAKRGVTTTTLGLGADYNEDLMAKLADAGLGRYFFVEKGAQLAKIFDEELRSLSAVVAREAVVEIAPATGVDVDDVIGFTHDTSKGVITIPAGDIYAGRTTDMLLRLRVDARQATSGQRVVNVKVSYRDVKAQARVAVSRPLDAAFTNDLALVEKSAVNEVAVKVESWRAANALLAANDAYNRGDVATGDKLLLDSSQRLDKQAAKLKAVELAKEAATQKAYQKRNADEGEAFRGVGSKMAKQRAWSMNKGSAY